MLNFNFRYQILKCDTDIDPVQEREQLGCHCRTSDTTSLSAGPMDE
jgi:hypothetical protein